MTRLPRLAHPGPRDPDRRQAVPATLVPLAGTLAAGRPVMAEVARLFSEAGCDGGILHLDGLVCDPFRYVLPAYATDAAHAAWYSATHAPAGRVTVGPSTTAVGWRDGAAFLHCHGQWSGAFGTAMGHLLPLESIIAEETAVRGIGATDAWFDAVPDLETNFTLFRPAGDADGRDGKGENGLLARLRPDEDVCEALVKLCADARFARARVHGLGSIVEPRFADGRHVPCAATEVRIDAAAVADGIATLDVSLVDVDGGIHAGRLAPGLNPVGVTFELLLESLP
jgi:predicted DNA-binding protein with PD1-like motif